MWHPDVTREVVEAAYHRRHTSLSDPGFCIECGLEYMSGIEPDARNYACESCGECAVFGIEELMMELH